MRQVTLSLFGYERLEQCSTATNEVHKNYCAKEHNYQGDSNDKVNLAVGHTHSLAPNAANDLADRRISKAPADNAAVRVMAPLAALRFDAVLSVKIIHGVQPEAETT
ncbi:MAG: hypothetical protein WCF66_09665 [Pseudolabrys sp.]